MPHHVSKANASLSLEKPHCLMSSHFRTLLVLLSVRNRKTIQTGKSRYHLFAWYTPSQTNYVPCHLETRLNDTSSVVGIWLEYFLLSSKTPFNLKSSASQSKSWQYHQSNSNHLGNAQNRSLIVLDIVAGKWIFLPVSFVDWDGMFFFMSSRLWIFSSDPSIPFSLSSMPLKTKQNKYCIDCIGDIIALNLFCWLNTNCAHSVT